MSSTQRPRAANVCVHCKARKKKCDKALPTCGYCARYIVALKQNVLTVSANFQ
jgi:hypothetical protein